MSPNQQHQQQQQSNLIEIASEQLGKLNYGTLLFSNLNETECIKYGHRESYKLTLFICGIILCLLIIMLNSLTLFTIVRSRRLYNSITNILVANLSISDFLSGVAFLYPCALNLLTINALETYNSRLYTLACNIRQNYYLCLMGYSPIITSMLSSMLTLTLLALEKYMAIIYPYAYERLINDRKYLCYLILFFVWLISIVVSLLPIMGWNEHNKYSTYRGFDCMHPNSLPCMFERIFTLDYILLFTSICGICALTMLAIYAQIYLTARKHSRQIAKQQKSLNLTHSSSKEHEEANTTGSIVELSERWSQQIPHHHSHHADIISESRASTITLPHVLTTAAKRSMKAMKTLLILLMGFYICWLPLIVYFLTFASKKYNNLTIYILMFIACCNALIDPLVYAFRNREFCKELLSNFRRR